MREHLQNAKAEREYRHLGTTVDIYIREDRPLKTSEAFLEIKRNLLSKALLDRLVGQIESLEPKKNAILVILCGEIDSALLGRLRTRYKVPAPGVYRVYPPTRFEIVVKEHAPVEQDLCGKRSSREVQKEVRAIVELHKRTIRATRVANNYFPELTRLRKTFLQYGLAEKSKRNREFFDKWLTHLVVELGWAPAGGWTLERISELHTDIETIKA